jgi:GNAT superfamily N-acetyltransferase
MAGEVSIRGGRLDEREALIALQRRASLMWEEDRQSLLDHPDAIDIPEDQITEGRVFVAEADGRTVGFGVVIPRSDGEAELDGLFVEPDAWGKGVGRQLMHHADALARSGGARLLNVVANGRAVGFYEACGFQAVRVVETRFSPGLEMIKALTLGA